MRRCRQTGREYLLCDYNRDGDSYRSPWSNEFDPPLDNAGGSGGGGGAGSDGGAGADEAAAAAASGAPTEKVRRMEVRANEAFDVYRELYYEGGVSSVYFWNLDDGFAGVVLLKKGEWAVTNPLFLFPLLICTTFVQSFCGTIQSISPVSGKIGMKKQTTKDDAYFLVPQTSPFSPQQVQIRRTPT